MEEVRMEAIGLVVPVMNNFRGFTEMMASVDYPIVPIVVNNWEYNHGVANAWNKGIQRAKEMGLGLTLVSNDDVVFEPGAIKTLVDEMDEEKVLDPADIVSPFNLRLAEVTITDVDFACFLVKTDFLDRFGLFDENFTPAYFEDNDMHYRVKLLGGKGYTVEEAEYFHVGSVTQFKGKRDGRDRVVTHRMFEANRGYYVKKWGGWPGKEKWSRPYNNPDYTPTMWTMLDRKVPLGP
jgi:GT2 family glycosyltransferase